jgi:hypothetical protein
MAAEKGWLNEVLEEARRDVNSRPEWQKVRVYGCQEAVKKTVIEKTQVTPDKHEV